MENMKFKIKSPEHSEEIQQELFRLGFRWVVYGANFYELDTKFLFTTEIGLIQWENSDHLYMKHPATETTLEELKAM